MTTTPLPPDQIENHDNHKILGDALRHMRLAMVTLSHAEPCPYAEIAELAGIAMNLQAELSQLEDAASAAKGR
jgi:hypothetical protein